MNIQVCPECGSGKVDTGSSILGNDAYAGCQSCGWSGTVGDLLTPMRQEDDSPGNLITPDQALCIAQSVAEDYMRRLAANAAKPVGLAMVESGIVGLKDRERLARLIRAAMQGAHKATLDEVEVIQKELLRGEEHAGN